MNRLKFRRISRDDTAETLAVLLGELDITAPRQVADALADGLAGRKIRLYGPPISNCPEGHALVLQSPGTFWITVDNGKVVDVAVTIDASAAGFVGRRFELWGCTEQAPHNSGPDDDALNHAEFAADHYDWPFLDPRQYGDDSNPGVSYVRVES